MNTLCRLELAIALAIASSACNGGLPTPIGSQGAPAVNDAPGIGLALGINPSAPITSLSLAGAEIPNFNGSNHQVMFVAFVTSAATDDADGAGPSVNPIDLSVNASNVSIAPDDNNGAEDVFLSAVVSATGDTSGAFNLRIFDVTQHPRCLTCHGQNYPGPCDVNSSHPNHAVQDLSTCTQINCIGCHTPAVTGFSTDLDGLPWRSPPFPVMPSDTNFDFRNRTPADLCQSIANRFRGDSKEVFTHLAGDPFIFWAITSSQAPFTPPAPLGRVPIDFESEWSVAVADWVAGFDMSKSDPVEAFNCVSLGSRRDIVLVSQTRAGGVAANAASRRPSITYVPNPAFQIGNPGAAAAGTVFVAFDSVATNLVAGDTNGVSDVFRSAVEVWVDEDFVMSEIPTAGSVDLRYVIGQNRRVSVRNQTSAQGTGHATDASISPDGNRIAFVSEDTNIADPSGNGVFDDDQNGFTDVFVGEVTQSRTQLVSTDVTGLSPGNGDSSAPAISANSNRGIVFESSATDLVMGDTNGVVDVFYALLGATSIADARTVARASTRNGGGQGVGGASSNACIHVIDADTNDVLVGFESAKTNLVNGLPPNATFQAYLHESATNRTTLLNQKRLPLLTLGTAQGGASPGDSLGVRITPDGRYVLFESLADNIDVVRPFDDNEASDIFRVDLATLLGTSRVRPERISITRDGQTADAASTGVLAGGFRQPGASGDGGPLFGGIPILFESQASNLPTDESNDAVLVFTP